MTPQEKLKELEGRLKRTEDEYDRHYLKYSEAQREMLLHKDRVNDLARRIKDIENQIKNLMPYMGECICP